MLIDHMISINIMLYAATKLQDQKYFSYTKTHIKSILSDFNQEYIEVSEKLFLVLYSKVEHGEWEEALKASERMLESLAAFEA